MSRYRTAMFLLWILLATCGSSLALADGAGQEDLDNAMRAKVTAQDMNDLNQVVQLLESAMRKGLDEEGAEFAAQMLNDALLERASGLLEVLDRVPPQRVAEDEQFRDQVRQMSQLIVSDLRHVLASDSPAPLAKLQMSRLMLKLGGDRAEAKGLLDQFLTEVEADQETNLPAFQVAQAYMLRAAMHGDADKAIEDLSRGIELDPNETKYRLARAALYRTQGEIDKSLEDVQLVIESAPSDEAGYLVQAEILHSLGRTDEALASLDKANEAVPEAWKPFQYRGQLLRSQGELDKAIDQFGKALQKEPDLPETLLARGEAYMEKQQYDEAAADIEAALEQRPGWLTAIRLKAQILASSEKLDEGIQELQRAIDAGGDSPEVRLQLALYHLVNQEPRAAIEQYSKVIEQDDDNFLALRHRGDAYITIGQHRAAMADFEAALKTQPNDSMLLNNLAWLLATSPDDDVRDGPRAIELATRASDVTEYKEAFILSTLAAAYAENGDFEEAEKWSQKAVELNDNENQAEQLTEELESYQARKPWRERQTIGDDQQGSEDQVESPVEQPAEQSIDF